MKTIGGLLALLVLFFIGSVLVALAGLPFWLTRVLVILVLLGLLKWADDKLTGGAGFRAVGWALRGLWGLVGRAAARRGHRLPALPTFARRPVPLPVPERRELALYTYYEPDDLTPGSRCACGKRRHPGGMVYVGKTVRGIRTRTAEHMDDKHWLTPDVICTTRFNFATVDELAAAERDAYDRGQPRENAVRPAAWASR